MLVGLLRRKDRRSERCMRVTRQRLDGALWWRYTRKHHQSGTQQIKLVQCHWWRVVGREAGILLNIVQPEHLVDGRLQALSPAAIAFCKGSVPCFTCQLRGQLQGLVVRNIGGQGFAGRHVRKVVDNPGRVTLGAPVQERLLAFIQARCRIVGRQSIGLQSATQGSQSLRGK